MPCLVMVGGGQQVLLEEELKRNRELRDQIAGTMTVTTTSWRGRAEGGASGSTY